MASSPRAIGSLSMSAETSAAWTILASRSSPGSFRPYFRMIDSNEQRPSSPWPSSTPGASNGMAPRSLTIWGSWLTGANRNSASLSMKRVMSQGQATRSTCTCERVIHNMVLSFLSGLALLAFCRELRVQRVVHERAAVVCGRIVGAAQADAAADQVQARRARLDVDLLHDIRLVDDACDARQQGVLELVLAQDRMEATMPAVMRVARAGDVERLCVAGQRLRSRRDEHELGFRVNPAANQPDAAHAVHADVLPRDPFHFPSPRSASS